MRARARARLTVKPRPLSKMPVQRWGDHTIRITGSVTDGLANTVGRGVNYDMTLEQAHALLENLTAALKEEEA